MSEVGEPGVCSKHGVIIHGDAGCWACDAERRRSALQESYLSAIIERHVAADCNPGELPWCKECGFESDHPCDALILARALEIAVKLIADEGLNLSDETDPEAYLHREVLRYLDLGVEEFAGDHNDPDEGAGDG